MHVVLLAAGDGKRLWPITTSIPKALVRVMGKPLLGWLLEVLGPAASDGITIVAGAHFEKIEEYVAGSKWKGKVSIVKQAERKGTAHALCQAEKTVMATGKTTKSGVLVVNADTFFDPQTLVEMVGAIEKKPNDYFIVGKHVEDGTRFGVLEEKNGKLAGIIEKPSKAYPCNINTGTYYVPRGFFEIAKNVKLSPRGEYEVTDALGEFAKRETMRVLDTKRYWNDVGYFWNLIEVDKWCLDNLLKDERLGTVESGIIVKGKLHVGKGSTVKAPCVIEGNVYIGEGTSVGPFAYLRDCTIENKCNVALSEVKRSIVYSESKISHYSHVTDSVIGERVNFGAGTQVANLRLDKTNVKVDLNGKVVDSMQRKLGCAVGNDTKIGCLVVINPGKLIGANCAVLPGTIVSKNINDNSKG